MGEIKMERKFKVGDVVTVVSDGVLPGDVEGHRIPIGEICEVFSIDEINFPMAPYGLKNKSARVAENEIRLVHRTSHDEEEYF